MNSYRTELGSSEAHGMWSDLLISNPLGNLNIGLSLLPFLTQQYFNTARIVCCYWWQALVGWINQKQQSYKMVVHVHVHVTNTS